ncbi:MAG: radical SAM protein [Nitrospiraceae bacterium]|nr:radical SAM protein [Nitrospiraceae bacterium]
MFSPFRHTGSILMKTRPIHLTFFVTKRCNSRCPFCFYRESRDFTGTGTDELGLDEINRISSSLDSLLWLAFSGGEIFLREDLVDIARTFYRNNRPAIMLLPTNGMLPELIRDRTEEILRDCGKSVVAVKLSLDGIGATHDRVRDTAGSFDKTMRAYELLGPLLERYPNFELGVNTVFSAENQDSMDNIIDFVRGLADIKTHTISLVRGNLSREEFKQVDFARYLLAIQRLEQNLKDTSSPVYRFRGSRIKAAQDIIQRRLIHRTHREQRSLIPCYAGSLNLVLTESGEVFPCEILTSSMGNARDHGYDINRILRTGQAREVISSIKARKCFCTHECYFMTNILFNPRLYPELLREYLLVRS